MVGTEEERKSMRRRQNRKKRSTCVGNGARQKEDFSITDSFHNGSFFIKKNKLR